MSDRVNSENIFFVVYTSYKISQLANVTVQSRCEAHVVHIS